MPGPCKPRKLHANCYPTSFFQYERGSGLDKLPNNNVKKN